jgi:hypothetical protein
MESRAISSIASARARGARDARPVQTDRLDDLIADPMNRIERGERILQHHADRSTAMPAQRAGP